MRFANLLGLDEDRFCKIIVTNKMFGMVNVLGHVAELQYEKHLKKNGIHFTKAGTDEHFDYRISGQRHQVKRWETTHTNDNQLGVNLTKTHGNRNGPDAYYKRTDFDNLILFDVGFSSFQNIKVTSISQNRKYIDRLPGIFTVDRPSSFSSFEIDFLNTLKQTNENFPPAIEKLREKYNLTYKEFLEKCSNLKLDEIDTLFSIENFRLVTGAKGFVAEAHFNLLLESRGIEHKQVTDMYSKVDHFVNGKKVQVKTIYPRSTDKNYWAFKTHKTHGHGEGELYKNDAFEIVALFVGYNYNGSSDKYTPSSTKTEFIFIPVSDLEDHPDYPGYLKRVSKVAKTKYKINDTTIF